MHLRIAGIAAFAALVVAGCAHKPSAASSDASQVTSSLGSEQTANLAGVAPGSVEDFRANVGDTVSFGYNEYNLDSMARETLSKQAAWLTRYPSVTLTVEGHCDERGTREYNLALGARRANAVREFLVAQGISVGRLSTTSFGKERPVCTASSEECWAENRRGVSSITSGTNS